jgi:hypothetical protein
MTLSYKIVKTRVEHCCWGCNDLFPPGSQLAKIVNVDSGTITNTYWCEICDSYWKEHMDSDDEIYQGALAHETHYQEYKKKWKTIKSLLQSAK